MAIKRTVLRFVSCAVVGFAFAALAPAAFAGDAPAWMHSLVSHPVPPQDEKTNAVVLYEDTDVTVVSADKVKTVVRRAYKILRPNGRDDYGTVAVPFNSSQKVTSIHAWCIPAQGKDYEVKEKDVIEVALPKVEGSELINDVKVKLLRIPAADPGNIVGYEYEIEEHPLLLEDVWEIQQEVPVLESHFNLQLPAGWEYKAAWLNTPEVKPAGGSSNSWDWTVTNQKAVRHEEDMPPMTGIAAHAVFSFLGPGASNSFANWQQMGVWYRNLTAGRTDASPEIKQKVAALTSGMTNPIDKMRVIADFIQHDMRYVAIELGIGGLQPHPASQVFSNRYGDCKDKATVTIAMLKEIGVEAYYVVINAERGGVGPDTPAHGDAFNHVIVAIRLPAGAPTTSLTAVLHDPKLGDLLFFDPTDELTPFGSINGALQANYGLLVGPDGGELVEVPQLKPDMNGINRTAKLTLDANGTLRGTVEEIRVGDPAWGERWALRTVSNEAGKIKPVETLLAGSLASFRLTQLTIENREQTNQPFGFHYAFEANGYAKTAGSLLLVRPRVLGVKSSGLLETKDPRQFPVEFGAPEKDTDNFEITLPAGYVVDELPPPVDADFGFASYHSRTEAKGNVIAYTRTYEIKQLSVPVEKLDQLKKFYRIIAGDERGNAVVRPQ